MCWSESPLETDSVATRKFCTGWNYIYRSRLQLDRKGCHERKVVGEFEFEVIA